MANENIPLRLHDLRHSDASLSLKAGASPKSISERLGHASISITMAVYAHLLPGIEEEAAQRFADLLAKSRGNGQDDVAKMLPFRPAVSSLGGDKGQNRL